MRSLYKYLLVLTTLLFFGIQIASAQVVTSDPPYPTLQDSVIVYFHADRGDQGLMGYSGSDIYAHTGVITSESTDGSDWRYVIAGWSENLPKAHLTRVDGDLWKLPIGDIREYYGVPEDEEVLQLAFVFRNSNGSQTGRAEGGDDIFLNLYNFGISAVLVEPVVDLSYGDPLRSPLFLPADTTVTITGTGAALETEIDSLYLFSDAQEFTASDEDTLVFDLSTNLLETGANEIHFVAQDTNLLRDTTSFVIMINPPVSDVSLPAEIEQGINYNENGSVTLDLYAPYKDFIYVIGDFNEWKVNTNYYMHRYQVTPDSVHWWITIDGLSSDQEYGFQYLVDGKLRVTDPYAEKVLDPRNDAYIPETTYPNLKAYPENKTDEYVGIINPSHTEYTWTTENYQRPEKNDLVVYELLIRDFLAAHDYATLIDTLGYLENLGINAIELMPVNEFDGNISWGYNPAFCFAPDKYYGPAEDLKAFIEECHSRGIAVILDMVLNHSFGQSPMVRLYNEGNYGAPTAHNPWFNSTARHPFNVGYDFNHESADTKYFVDRVNAFWLTEYNVDGFRFDLSKGFTQRNSGGDVGYWSQYDASRIAILERMANRIWEVNPGAFVILEHFAENSEEIELSNDGMLLWGNMNVPYSQSAMGHLNDASRSSDLSWGFYQNRGWNQPNVVTYMESHDEPWLMWKNLQYGNSSGDYDIQDLETALQRIQLAATFFLTYPGPKMLWQFGELGYDEELPEDGRTDPKPIHWEYLEETARRNLYDFYSALLHLRSEYAAFTDPAASVSMRVGQGVPDRRINIGHSSMNVTIIGNFGVTPIDVNPNFPHGGRWYEYFTGDTLDVANTQETIALAPGQFKLFTTEYIPTPDVDVPTALEPESGTLPAKFAVSQNYPNPFNARTVIRYALPEAGDVDFQVYNLRGQLVSSSQLGPKPAGYHSLHWSSANLSSGLYFYVIKFHGQTRTVSETQKLMLIK